MHDCIMVRITRSYRIQVSRTKMRLMADSPRILTRKSDTSRRRAMPKAPAAVHHRSACSGVKACPWLEQGALRNTSETRSLAGLARGGAGRSSALKALLAPFLSDEMICWPVNARVGDVKNNDASLIESIDAVSH
jgi:hypothetical protein